MGSLNNNRAGRKTYSYLLVVPLMVNWLTWQLSLRPPPCWLLCRLPPYCSLFPWDSSALMEWSFSVVSLHMQLLAVLREQCLCFFVLSLCHRTWGPVWLRKGDLGGHFETKHVWVWKGSVKFPFLSQLISELKWYMTIYQYNIETKGIFYSDMLGRKFAIESYHKRLSQSTCPPFNLYRFHQMSLIRWLWWRLTRNRKHFFPFRIL